jgi:hypothetical protein
MHKNKMQVVFRTFNVRQLVAIDRRNAAERTTEGGIVKIAPEIAFGYVEKKRAPFFINLVIRIKVLLERDSPSSEADVAVESFLEGEAEFELRNLGLKKFNETFHDMNFLDKLADQAYPLAICRLKNALSELNFKTDFPLSLPAVENRIKIVNGEDGEFEEVLVS